MLVPLTRQSFEELIPAVATSEQYKYYWGKFPDLLKRLLISTVIICAMIIVYFINQDTGGIIIVFVIIGGLYWFWAPVLWASLRNIDCRKYKYCGFWQGRVLDVFVTEELVGQEESVNKKGQLVIIDNFEERINVEVGDTTGFSTIIKAPFKRVHDQIQPGQAVLMLVMSNEPDLGQIEKVSDIYIPSRKIWVSDYPYLRRDLFLEISNTLKKSRKSSPPSNEETPRKRRETRTQKPPYYD
jgi:hypothetical protein